MCGLPGFEDSCGHEWRSSGQRFKLSCAQACLDPARHALVSEHDLQREQVEISACDASAAQHITAAQTSAAEQTPAGCLTKIAELEEVCALLVTEAWGLALSV
jgi:hypothetical protein